MVNRQCSNMQTSSLTPSNNRWGLWQFCRQCENQAGKMQKAGIDYPPGGEYESN